MDSLKYFDANTELLFSRLPTLKAALARYQPDGRLEIVPTPAGAPSALYAGLSVHSRRDPGKEARTLIEKEINPAVGIGVFYGFGLGYLPEEFIRAYPDSPCLIVEPDVPLFLAALASRDLERVLNHPRAVFFLASEPTPVIRYLDSLPPGSVQVVKLRSLYEKDRAYYERVDELIQSYLRQRDVNRHTLRRFGRLWVRNLAQNIRLLGIAPGIRAARDLCAGLPALVCAGGPSLDEVLPRLRELRERMLVIAVDTTLAALQRQGVDPDLTVIADPQYWNTRHLDGVKRTGTIIVSESSTHPRIFRRLGERVIFASSVFPLGRYLETLVGEKGKLGAGGSVATTAWDCARFLGCAPVYLAGLDLGFPAGRTHFRGAHFEEVFYSQSSRLRPLESRAFGYLREAQPFPVEDNAGGLVLTDHRMAVYKFWFETQMSLHPDSATYNLSRAGVRLAGMPAAEIERALSLPPCRPLIDEKMASLGQVFPLQADETGRLAALKNGIASLLAGLEAVTAVARDGVRIAQDLKRRRSRGASVASNLQKLEAVDRRIGEQSAKHIIGFLAGPLIQEINQDSGGAHEPERWLELSLRLYRELESSGRFHIDVLKKSLTRL